MYQMDQVSVAPQIKKNIAITVKHTLIDSLIVSNCHASIYYGQDDS